ncbi:lysozyme-like [Actinia tenebrosa]|uniref:lysozyme n=1 Tax=Actinia tenebrosa TaxID=6105 RepID=A0A6P8HMR8_ACTTE|nr:lysozyme-like [Actinia tenebrosa]
MFSVRDRLKINLLPIKLFAIVLLTVVGSEAARKTKCEVVSALRAQGVPDGDLRDWLCLVENESSFRYDITNEQNDNGSKDYGIFQLSNGYWCDRPHGTTSSICWRLNTYGCHVSCSNLLNSDISDDAECAVRIKNCKGFREWAAWRDDCSDVSGSEFDYSSC